MLLSKSKYLCGLQCPLLLWVGFNDKKRIPSIDASTLFRFDQGHLLGEYAKKLFPYGLNIPTSPFMANVKLTKKLLKQGKVLFEPGFMAGNIYSRADILVPVKDEWDIIEVKSTTSVKDINIHDVAFQKHCYIKSGLKIRKCFLMFVNNEYVRDGDINVNELFVKQDISSEVDEALVGIEGRIEKMFGIISSKEPSKILGLNCNSPYECPLRDECWDFLEDGNVFELCMGGKKSFELFNSGVLKIRDIPDSFRLNAKQQIQKECSLSGKPHISSEEIKCFLKTLHYPVYFLDFETIATAVPLFNGVRPYQPVPFQFSLHVVGKNGSKEHFSFLSDGKGDPRPKFISSLKKVLGSKGSIVVYNKSFEIGVLRGLFFQKEKKWVEDVVLRIVDLIVLFRNFSFYDSAQKGSASLKKVLPAVTGKNYNKLEIADGMTASLEFLRIMQGDVSDKDKEKLRKNLEKYCCLDTEGMVWIVDGLKGI